jgi:hypothetical protein
MDLSTIVDGAGAALTAVGGASLLAALLPRSDKLAWLFKLLDILAANWAQARNARQ